MDSNFSEDKVVVVSFNEGDSTLPLKMSKEIVEHYQNESSESIKNKFFADRIS